MTNSVVYFTYLTLSCVNVWCAMSVCLLHEGVAEAFVCLWKSPHMLARVNSSTVSKLVSCVLDLLDTDRLPQGAGETGVVRHMCVWRMFIYGILKIRHFEVYMKYGT